MRPRTSFLSSLGLVFLLSPALWPATLTGTVKSPDGSAFEGARS